MVGREYERKELMKAYDSQLSEFVAVYGRRRIGKTFLVRETFNGMLAFQHTGVARGKQRRQLAEFRRSLKNAGCQEARPFADWFDAFDCLGNFIAGLPIARKIVFLDELPWMDTGRADFVSALEHFWNGWASARKDIVLIVCGSATSWMIDKVIKDKGGLHNRVTRNVFLEAFSLAECRAFVDAQRWPMTDREIVETYMAIGGVPFYWTLLEKGNSVAQNFDLLFFGEHARMKNEFSQLYASLFKRPETYLKIVRTLSCDKAGMTRAELIERAKVANNGKLRVILTELEACGFIRRYVGFGKRKRDAVYQLVDAFTLFYFQFMRGEANADPKFWTTHVSSPAISAWRGLAFERVCLAHVGQIKSSLGISGVSTNVYAWSHRPTYKGDRGVQIDLIIDRADGVVNVCEIKFVSGLYDIGSREEVEMETKLDVFRRVTQTMKSVRLTLITMNGVTNNPHGHCVQSMVTMKDLFRAEITR